MSRSRTEAATTLTRGGGRDAEANLSPCSCYAPPVFKRLDYKWIVGIVFVVALFMDILDTTIVNVALPRLGVEFSASSSIEWVVTGYLLSLAIWIPCSGWIGDRFGTKRTFLFALAMFTGASALCGLAQSLDQLIVFRILQGAGGGMLAPVGTTMLYRAFPPAERAKASAVLTIPTVIAPALGPLLGGLLVDHASWRWIFYVNLPMGAAGFLFGWKYLREETQDAPGRFDLLGFLLSGIGLALILYGLSEAPRHGWDSATVLGALAVGLASFALLIVTQLRRAEPMLHLRLFASPLFRTTNIVGFFAFGGFIAGVFLLPFYVQSFRGYSALRSGLTQFPQAVAVIMVGRLIAMRYPVIGPRRLLLGGVLGTSVATACLVFVQDDTTLWLPAGLFFARGLSMACVFIPLQAAAFSQISPRDTGRASALFQTARQIGASLGVALTATVLFSGIPRHIASAIAAVDPRDATARAGAVLHGQVGAFHDAVLVAVGFGVLGMIGAFFIRDLDAAASMKPRTPPVPTPAPVEPG